MCDSDYTLPADTLPALLDHWARQQPQAPFLIAPEDGTTLDFAALREAAAEVAARLAGLGLAPGDTVSLMMSNGPTTATLFLGAMYGGFVISPLNPLAGAEQLAFVLEHSQSRAVLVCAEHRPALDAACATADCAPQLIAAEPDGVAEWPAAAAAITEPQAADTALLMYTSGTTGRPKGVPLSHRALLHGGLNTVIAHQLGRSDRALCVLPLYHINGQVVTVIAPLVSGGSVVMPRRFSATRFWRWLIEQRCSWFSVVPTIIAYLLKGEDALSGDDHAALRRVRFGRSASAPLPPAIHREFEQRFGICIVETMGLTETAAQILSNPLDKSLHKLGSPGIAYGNQVIVADDAGRQCAPGETGELWVRGANVMDGYFKNPEATASTFSGDGWLRTGDLGHCDEAGYFFITGRLKELIIKGGENIAPREIDDVLYRHAAVLEAAAVGLPDADYGQQVDACVVLKPGACCDAQTLRDLCTEHLSAYKTPRDIYFLAEAQMPKGPSGKIQRLKLVDLIQSGQLARA